MKKPTVGSLYVSQNNHKDVYRLQYVINGKRKIKTFPKTEKGKKDAYAFAKELKETMDNERKGIFIQSSPLLADYIIEYIKTYKLAEVKRNEIKRGTFERIKQTAKLIPKELTDKPMNTVIPNDIQKACNQVSETHSPSSVIKMYDLLRNIFTNAQANHFIQDNPFISLKRPKLITKKKTVYTAEEVLTICNTIRKMKTNKVYNSIKHDYYLLFKIMITTGMRIGEVLALQWQDFDTENNEIKIQRTINPYEKETKTGTPKTLSGKRTIKILSPYVSRKLTELKTKSTTIGPFYTERNKPVYYQNFSKTWKSIGIETASECPKCHTRRPNGWTCSNGHTVNRNQKSCPECKQKRPPFWTCPNCGTVIREIHKSPHTSRHTFCSYLMEKGVNVQFIKEYVGHSQASTTLDIYGHTTEKSYDELYKKLNLKQIKPPKKKE